MATSALIRRSHSLSRGRVTLATSGRCRALCATALLAVLSLSAQPATSAQLVSMRLGAHADYSRVVFELDVPAAYRIERNEPAPGVSELVVSLQAGTALRGPRLGKSLIERVDIESRGPASEPTVMRMKPMFAADGSGEIVTKKRTPPLPT